MKKSILLFLALGLLACFKVSAQDDEEKKFGIQFKGYVKNDFILDSRQVITAREGHFLLYPADEKLDIEGNDINARASFNYLSIQTRLTGVITGPDAFGAKTSGLIEGAFFGNIAPNINSFRLRHAFIKLNWPTTEVLLGQFWHLMFNTACFPGTVSFNTGAPYQFFSRNPQIRISQKLGNFKLTGSAATQLDFVSPGGSVVLRNALLPDLSGQLSYSNDKILAGLSAGYKQVVPRLETDSLYKTTKAVGGFTAQAFFKHTTKPITYKIQATFSQNGYDGLFIGGYAVQSISDVDRDYREYTTIDVITFWADVLTNSKKFQGGLFLGYSHNLGSTDEIEEIGMISRYTRGYDIGYMIRIAPRFIVNSGKARLAVELESTGAAYGESVNSFGVPQNTKLIFNHRILVATYYFF